MPTRMSSAPRTATGSIQRGRWWRQPRPASLMVRLVASGRRLRQAVALVTWSELIALDSLRPGARRPRHSWSGSARRSRRDRLAGIGGTPRRRRRAGRWRSGEGGARRHHGRPRPGRRASGTAAASSS
jgi:hypothetical protein